MFEEEEVSKSKCGAACNRSMEEVEVQRSRIEEEGAMQVNVVVVAKGNLATRSEVGCCRWNAH